MVLWRCGQPAREDPTSLVFRGPDLQSRGRWHKASRKFIEKISGEKEKVPELTLSM